jgi:hypothetical protein
VRPCARQVDRLRAVHEAAGAEGSAGPGPGPGAGVVLGMGGRVYPHQTVPAPPLCAARPPDPPRGPPPPPPPNPAASGPHTQGPLGRDVLRSPRQPGPARPRQEPVWAAGRHAWGLAREFRFRLCEAVMGPGSADVEMFCETDPTVVTSVMMLQWQNRPNGAKNAGQFPLSCQRRRKPARGGAAHSPLFPFAQWEHLCGRSSCLRVDLGMHKDAGM